MNTLPHSPHIVEGKDYSDFLCHCAKALEIPLSELLDPTCKREPVTTARTVAIYTANKLFDLQSKQLHALFNLTCHSTARHALKRCNVGPQSDNLKMRAAVLLEHFRQTYQP